MNRIIIAIAAIVFSAPAFGQSSATSQPVPAVRFGGIGDFTTENGNAKPIVTTRAELLGNTAMMVAQKGCDVTGFTFSILPKGGDLIGPFTTTGAQLTGEMQQLIKDNTGRIFVENIKVKCGAQEMQARPILMRYDN